MTGPPVTVCWDPADRGFDDNDDNEDWDDWDDWVGLGWWSGDGGDGRGYCTCKTAGLDRSV